MPKRKLHKFIDAIEKKHCFRCDNWKSLDQFMKNKSNWDGKYCYCKTCFKIIKNKRYRLRVQQRMKACEEAPTGYSVCLNSRCTIRDPKLWNQPNDQFIDPKVHTHTLTRYCLTCRKKNLTSVYKMEGMQACQKLWDDYRKTHPCIECNKDPKYKHNYLVIEADHVPEFGKKEKECSQIMYWGAKSRGVVALQTELKKCRPLCKFHHRLVTQQRSRNNRQIPRQASVLIKRAVINKEKHKRGSCLRCRRLVIVGEECGFSFDHRDPTTKFIFNGKPVSPSKFVELRDYVFNKQWPLEQAKCDLLCANCDKLKTFECKDGYK